MHPCSYKRRFSVTEFHFREVFLYTLVGYPLFRGRFSRFFIFSSEVNCEEFVLRSLNASPLIKPFVNAWWVTRIKIRVLKILSSFVCFHVKDSFFVESCTFVHFRVQERPSLCMFVSNRYFTHKVYFIPWFRVHLKHSYSDHNTSRDLEFDKNVPRLVTTGAINLKKKQSEGNTVTHIIVLWIPLLCKYPSPDAKIF